MPSRRSAAHRSSFAPDSPAVRRNRSQASNGAYTLFYCGVALGVGLLIYAGLFLATPPAARQVQQSERAVRHAAIQLAEGDGKGQCRQVVFDNATGRFEEAGMSRCRHLIPDELLVDTVQSRAGKASAFRGAFSR